MKELELFPKEIEKGLEVLFVNFGSAEEAYCLPLVKSIRKKGIACELYPSKAKMQKQMKYANDVNVKYVAIVGENEMVKGVIQLKNMESGDQVEVNVEELIAQIKN
jgi:histidyl-tRNA synthetase